MTTCVIPSCTKEAVGRGWCHAHYKNWSRRGAPVAVLRPRDHATRFELQYTPVTETGCWLWTGTVGSNGYGQFGHDYKLQSAHRASYERHVGKVPKGLYVLHKCDVKLCVNPAHLYVGTALDNRQDAIRRGRVRYARGVGRKDTKLSDDAVRAIAASTDKGTVLAKRYNISRTTVSEIKSGRKRSSVTGLVYSANLRGG